MAWHRIPGVESSAGTRLTALRVLPRLAGLDIDALRDVSKAVNGLKSQQQDMGILMVTHYKVGAGMDVCWTYRQLCRVWTASSCAGKRLSPTLDAPSPPTSLWAPPLPPAAPVGLHPTRLCAHHAGGPHRDYRGHGSG